MVHRLSQSAKAITVAAFLIAAVVAAPASGFAETDAKVSVTEADAVNRALQQMTGKSVTIKLRAGDEVSGVVEAVGATTLRLGKLTGKELFSALIKLDDISAVIYRAS